MAALAEPDDGMKADDAKRLKEPRWWPAEIPLVATRSPPLIDHPPEVPPEPVTVAVSAIHSTDQGTSL